MRQAVRRPTHTKPSIVSRISHAIRILFFGLCLILAFVIFLSLISYSPEDPAWSKAIQTTTISNWLGYKGAYFSDIVFTALGRCAWYIPLLIIAYAFQLFYKNKIGTLSFETFLIRLIGVIFVFITLSGLYDISGASNINGGIIGQWIGTKFTMFSFSWITHVTDNPSALLYTSQAFLAFLLVISAILASGTTPLYWLEAVGKGIFFVIQSIFNRSIKKKKEHNTEKSTLATIEHLMERKPEKTATHHSLLSKIIPSKKAEPTFTLDQGQEQLEETTQPTQKKQDHSLPKNIDTLLLKKAEPNLTVTETIATPILESDSKTINTNIPKVFVQPKIREQEQPSIATEQEAILGERALLTKQILELTNWVNQPQSQEQDQKEQLSKNEVADSLLMSMEQRYIQEEPSFDLLFDTPLERTKTSVNNDQEHKDLISSLEKFLNPKHQEEASSSIPEFDEFFFRDEVPPSPLITEESIPHSDKPLEYTYDTTLPEVRFEDEIPLENNEVEKSYSTNLAEPKWEEPSFNIFYDKSPENSDTHEGFTLIQPTLETDNDHKSQIQRNITPEIKNPILAKPLMETHNYTETISTPKTSRYPMYNQLPDPNLLGDPPPYKASYNPSELNEMAQLIEEQLKHFGITVNVANIEPGPVITRFELDLAPGIKVAQINNLSKDIARAMSVTSVRVVDIIPGKTYVGLEIPNTRREIVYFKEGLQSEEYQESNHPLTMILGKDIAGETLTANLGKMPHLLVAGTTGSGKSVGINTMLLSLLFKATPDELRLILIDPKMLELSVYNDIPHLLAPVVTDMKESANALRWCVAEMERRYLLMSQLKVRNIAGFNKKIKDAIQIGTPIIDPLWNRNDHVSDSMSPPTLKPLPFIVVVIDEFADMMMLVGKKCEELIARLAQKARASGIHLILATQRPSVDVITGLIKANIPTRIAFQVSSKIDSRTILDQQGAETLLGHGDMLYLPPGVGIPIRVHGAFVDDHEVNKVVEFLKLTGEPDYIEDILNEPIEPIPGLSPEASGVVLAPSDNEDPLFDEAVKVVIESKRASISYVQRKLRVGYQRAARLIEEMEEQGIISAPQSNGSRDVLISHPSIDDDAY